MRGGGSGRGAADAGRRVNAGRGRARTGGGRDLRCSCGSLLARIEAGDLEIRCRRCKRTVRLELRRAPSGGGRLIVARCCGEEEFLTVAE